MVHCPSLNDRIEGFDKVFLFPCLCRLNNGPHFIYDCSNSFLRGLYQEFPFEFSEISAQEIEPIIYMNDFGLFLREFKPSFMKKFGDEFLAQECRFL